MMMGSENNISLNIYIHRIEFLSLRICRCEFILYSLHVVGGDLQPCGITRHLMNEARISVNQHRTHHRRCIVHRFSFTHLAPFQPVIFVWQRAALDNLIATHNTVCMIDKMTNAQGLKNLGYSSGVSPHSLIN